MSRHALALRCCRPSRDICFEVCHIDSFSLIGAGESGKSTIAKQMKIIHLEGYTDSERAAFRDVVHSNIVMCIKALITACENFELKLNKKNKVRSSSLQIFFVLRLAFHLFWLHCRIRFAFSSAYRIPLIAASLTVVALFLLL